MKINWSKIIELAIRIIQVLPQSTNLIENFDESPLSGKSKRSLAINTILHSVSIPNHLAEDDRVREQVGRLVDEQVSLNNILAAVDEENSNKGIVG